MQETTAANPFFALELGRELERLGSWLQPGQPLPLPGSLAKLLGGPAGPPLPGDPTGPADRRVGRLVRRPTVIVAAHGERDEALDALDEATREGVVELIDGRVQFVHPLFASVLYDQVPLRVAARRTAHSVGR